MGFAGVLIGQIVVLLYYVVRRYGMKSTYVQTRPPDYTTLLDDLKGHASAPESFFMVFGYLTFVWMWKILPPSYYDLNSPVNWFYVLVQFLVVDIFTFMDHLIEHNWPALYKRSHKSHHKFTTPKLYVAFNGAPLDTLSLILIPLFLTSQICYFVNCWSFIAFGAMYASQFTLIHCEFPHPWDHIFQKIGIGTAADHNIHHRLVMFNYGHFFMYWDMIYGTYKNPSTCEHFTSYKQSTKKIRE